MSITVKPDPDHPLGGHALLVVQGKVSDGPVMVSVTDLYEDRHLGTGGWQQAPVSLGPYEARDEAGALVVPVGPEVVDRIEAFAPLRLGVGGVTAELAWPDSVRTSPARAGLGGLGNLSGNQPVRPQPAKPKPEPKPEPPKAETPPKPVDPPIRDEEPETKRPRSPLPLILALLLLLLAAAGGGAWWWMNRPQPDQVVTVPPPAPEPAPAPAPTPAPVAGCDAAGLTAAAALPPAEGFAAVAACGAEGDPEARFRVIQAAADAGLGEALAMIGRWYDPAKAAAVGSNFASRDAGQAARYYREAKDKGYAEAEALLARACAALDPDANPTHEIVREQHCPRP